MGRFVAALLLVPVLCLRVGGPRPAGSSRVISGPAMLVAERLESVVTPFGPTEEGRLKVMIAGGGIGGLCTALVLQKQGHDVHIYEKTSSYRPFGGPIQIASNALESIKRIDQDVYEAILARATSIGTRKNGLKDGVSNEWFATFDLYAPARRRGQDSSVVIDRPILQEILLEVRRRGRDAPLAVPGFGSYSASRRRWWLEAARYSQGETWPRGAQPPAQGPEPAASHCADSTAFDWCAGHRRRADGVERVRGDGLREEPVLEPRQQRDGPAEQRLARRV